jgi:PKD domain
MWVTGADWAAPAWPVKVAHDASQKRRRRRRMLQNRSGLGCAWVRGASAGVVVGLIACLLVVCGSASAAATWLTPVDLSPSNAFAEAPSVAADAQGDTTAVWDQETGGPSEVEASVHPVGGGWQTPVDLSVADDDSELPVVAVDPRGDATVVWVDESDDIVKAAVRPAGGAWSVPVDLSAASGGGLQHNPDPHVVVDAHGDAAAVWEFYDAVHETDSVQATVRPAGGAWEAPVDLDSGELSVANPRLAIDPQGDVTAVWSSLKSIGANDVARAAVLPAGGAWQPSVDLSETSQSAFGPQVTIDPRGDTTAIWDLADPTSHSNVVQASVRQAGGSWQTPIDISVGFTTHFPADPQVAADPQGDTTAIWDLQNGTTSPFIVQAATRPAGGTWQTPADLSTGSQASSFPELAVDPKGDTTAVWDLYDGTSHTVQTALRAAGGTWQTPVDISAGSQDPIVPVVAVDPQGDATEVSQINNGVNFVIQAAGYDTAGPELRALSVPATGTVGVPVSFSVSPLDAWSPVASTSWSFGDSHSAIDQTVTHTYAQPGNYTISVSSSDTLANATTATASITIAPAPAARTSPAGAAGPPGHKPPSTPSLTHLSQTHSRWRESAKKATPANQHKPRPVGTTFAFTLNETARVSFAFTQTVSGRKLSGQCQPTTKHNHSHPRCRRTLTRGTLTHATKAGRHAIAFQGQISNHKRLPLGAYTLKVTATNTSTQHHSAAQTLRFAIVQ